VQGLQTADAAADQGARTFRFGARFDARIVAGHLRRRDGVLAEEVKATGRALVDVLDGVEVGHLGGDVHALVAVVEARDLTHGRLARDQAAPEAVDLATERRDHAHAGDDDAPRRLSAGAGVGCTHSGVLRVIRHRHVRPPDRHRPGA